MKARAHKSEPANLKTLMGKAVAVFRDGAVAQTWVTSPQFGLRGAIPLEYAVTTETTKEVENLLGRIEYGVYS